jgi:hypothetical protein
MLSRAPPAGNGALCAGSVLIWIWFRVWQGCAVGFDGTDNTNSNGARQPAFRTEGNHQLERN